MQEFWELVAARRRAAGITQQELAGQAGLSVGALRDIEQGRTKLPRPAAARRLFTALGLPEAELTPYLADRSRPEAVRFRVLGGLRVRVGDRAVELGPPKQRTVLGVLALSPNTLIHRDAIAEAVWGGLLPAAPARLIPTYLSQLRQALSPARRGARNLIVSDGPRYRLAVADDEHDLLEFRHLLRRAAAAEPGTAAGLYEQALGLFDDEPVADLDGLHSLPEVAAIRIERITAVLAFADVALSVGKHAAVLPHLRVAAATEPLHGGVQARLMRALAAGGQVPAALQHFQAVRRRLRDELGLEPDAELVAAHQQILRQEPFFLRAEVTPVVPAQLPADTGDFTGRGPETARLRELLDGDGTATTVCAITGPGGIGKTALAVHVAHQVRHQFPDGQLYLDLHGAHPAPVPASDALADMLGALGVPRTQLPPTEHERAARFRSLLADRRMLVVLDNARDPAQIRSLLPGSPGSAVLVTSRHTMTVLPGVKLCKLAPLAEPDAADLLCRVADVEPGSPAADAANALARLCGGLPLALRVAGARAAEDGLTSVADRLAGEAWLRELELDDLSVAANFGLSVDLLGQTPDHSARLFPRLGLLQAPDFGIPVAARLLGVSETAAWTALTHLARVHLVDQRPDGRCTMHDLLRMYAAERGAALDPKARTAALRRVVHWYVATGRNAALLGRPQQTFWADDRVTDPGSTFETIDEALAWAEDQRETLVATVRQALGDPELGEWGLLLVEVLCFAFDERGFSEQWEQVLELACATAERLGDVEKELYTLQCLGRSVASRDPAASLAIFRRTLEHYRSLGNVKGASSALINLGIGHHRLGKRAEALSCYEQAHEHVRGAGSRAEGYALVHLAGAHLDLGLLDQAREEARRAIDIARERSEPHLELDATDALARAYRAGDDLGSAVDAHASAVALARELADEEREAVALAGLGETHLAGHDALTALCVLAKAETVFEATGRKFAHGRTLRLMGEAYHAAGDRAAGQARLRRALNVLDQLGVPDADEVRALLEHL